jgi:hypothetical protein
MQEKPHLRDRLSGRVPPRAAGDGPGKGMERTTRIAVLALCAATFGIGCGGGGDDYENRPRPPAPIVVSASIADDGISVSPQRFGAGPVTLIVTNQTDSAQELRLETDELGGDAPGIQQDTGPINPGDTASLKADLRQGTYRVGVGEGAQSTALNVGAPRPSAKK